MQRNISINYPLIQEWKNDLLRGHDPAQYNKYKLAFEEKGNRVQEDLAELKKLLSSLEISTPLIQEASDSLDKLNETYLGALAQYETGQVLKSLSEMNDSLKRIVTSVREGTESIASSTAEIAESNQSLSTRTVQQASSLDQTASTMEE